MAKRKADVIKVDFAQEEGGGRARVPEGDYRLKVAKVKHTTSERSGNPMLVWTFQIVGGNHDGKNIVDNTVLVPKALFRLRQLLEALGVNVPKRMVSLPLKKLVGKELGANLVDGEPYGERNRVSSEVNEYMSLDVLEQEEAEDEDEDEEEEDLEDEDEDDDEDEEEDEDEDDDELEEVDLDEL
jgi:hypothetical protein